MTQTIVYILICINVVTFLVYGIDKWKAKQGSWRISEATLLILAVIGGSWSPVTIRHGGRIAYEQRWETRIEAQAADGEQGDKKILAYKKLTKPLGIPYK